MRRTILRAAGGLVIAGVLTAAAATSVFAAAPAHPSYEVVTGNFGRMSSATAAEAKLVKAGLTGFKIQKEHVGKGLYQVERPFTTKAAATAELAKLTADHIRAGIEVDARGAV